MQIIDANTLVGSSVEGVRGSLTQMSAIDDANFGTQILVIPAHTKAPKPGTRLGTKHVLFVLQGTATLSNGEFYQKITPGKLVILDPGEERVFQTEKEKCVCLEIRVGEALPPAPATVPSVAFEPIQVPLIDETPKKKSQAIYEEI
jgi:mannose-6-phosphate isomerase-like protein (cupin superfamily)